MVIAMAVALAGCVHNSPKPPTTGVMPSDSTPSSVGTGIR
jgi:hypothetical protein